MVNGGEEMTYKATCDKCKMITIVGFNLARTEQIAARPKTCAFCNDDKLMTVTIDKVEDVKNEG